MAMRKIWRKFIPKVYGQVFNLMAPFNRRYTAQMAFRTFARVRKGRVKPIQRDYLEAARYRVEDISGHKIQTYRWPATGPRVLLLHGWESNTFRWRNLIAVLVEANFDILAFDAPAHGHSSGVFLHVFLYTECLEFMVRTHQPQHIIGHSMGGLTALYHAHRHPGETVEKIVTIGSPSEFDGIMDNYQGLLGFNNRVRQAIDVFMHEEFGFRLKEFTTAEFTRKNTKKGLILHDREDTVVPFRASQKVHDAWQDSILVPTEGLGHSMHQDWVNHRILEFLQAD